MAANVHRRVGQPVPLADGLEKVTAVYTHDFELPDMTYAAVVRSPWPHAEILEVDIAKALEAPGVRAIVSGFHDVERAFLNYGPAFADRYPLARDRVRFVGEEVAALSVGSCVHVPAGTAHWFESNGTDPLITIGLHEGANSLEAGGFEALGDIPAAAE